MTKFHSCQCSLHPPTPTPPQHSLVASSYDFVMIFLALGWDLKSNEAPLNESEDLMRNESNVELRMHERSSRKFIYFSFSFLSFHWQKKRTSCIWNVFPSSLWLEFLFILLAFVFSTRLKSSFLCDCKLSDLEILCFVREISQSSAMRLLSKQAADAQATSHSSVKNASPPARLLISEMQLSFDSAHSFINIQTWIL